MCSSVAIRCYAPMTDAGGLPTPAGSNQRRVDELAVDDWVSTVPTLAVASAAPAVCYRGLPGLLGGGVAGRGLFPVGLPPGLAGVAVACAAC
jgi:hypothetical protein